MDVLGSVSEHAQAWSSRALAFGRTRRARNIGIAIVVVIFVYGLAGFFAVPLLLRHILTGPVATQIKRPVTVGKIGFNPYALRLDIDRLHIGDTDPQKPFVDIEHLRVEAAWRSLLRLAPVIEEVSVKHPSIHIVRIAPQRFNFSDLLEPKTPPTPVQPSSKPFKFSVSNISLTDGDVHLDDQVVGQQHAIEHLQIGIPFVADLPRDVDIYVQPLLRMDVDGSPVRIGGQSKPFGATRDSIIELNLHQLDLSRYLGYVPRKLPVKIPQGTFSCALQVHFVAKDTGPVIAIAGELAIDHLDVRDTSGAPVATLEHAMAMLNDVEPLQGRIHLGKVRVDGLNANLVRNHDGSTNLSALTAANPAPAESAAAPQTTTAAPAPSVTAAPVSALAAAPATTSSPPPDVSVDSFELAQSAVKVTDNTGSTPATVSITPIHAQLGYINLGGGAPSPYELAANLSGGGSIEVKGGLDYAHKQVTSEVTIATIDLPALQDFAQSMLAAKVTGGKLSAQATVKTNFSSDAFNVHTEPANVSLDGFALSAPKGRDQPISWNKVSVAIGQIDLASRQATVNEIRADGIRVFVRREPGGKLSLLDLMKKSAPPPRTRRRERAARARRRVKPARAKTPAASPWRFRIASVAIEKTDARFEDAAAPRPVKISLAPLNIHLKDVTSDFAKPFGVELDGALNGRGTFKVTGDAAIAPLRAKLRVVTQRLDLTPADPYATGHLNATIKSALLTMSGAVALAQERKSFHITYRGDATLGELAMLDKLTNERFLNWRALSLSRIDADFGAGPPKLHIGAVALSDFYSRIILNHDAKLNLNDLTANPNAAPKSLTEERPTQAAAPEAAPTAAAATTGQPINADLAIGRITLQGGKVDYSDFFIKPNYTANLSDIAGKVSAFGTHTSAPAAVELNGQVNGSAPVEISGSINPLAPAAFIDLTAKADGIELTGLTAYSTHYTGYPITKGTLTVNVHYLLDQGNLTADNHIFIDQLTFGDRVENATATNLPIRLAVSLLENSRGEINVDVPISGSLKDPQFSLGGVILHAFMNLIVKAATSPFSLLSAAFGGGKQDLSYVEFAPGSAALSANSKSRLDTLIQALQDRTGLKVTIEGRVDPTIDREGLLDQAMKAQKLKATGGPSGALDSVKIAPNEYDKYLTRAYKAAKFKKPADFLGLNKSMPPDQMKKLMLANTSDSDLRALADARAAAVRAYLSAKINPARLFLSAPKLNASGIKDQGKTTRVDLSLQ
ncbi:MAG TPA: DUF748 domain-containing protein [Candidatus Binataceae bacterium]|nr:DUF748 domain-containing protein [Candidatus Binataceae bacterium]